MTLNVQKYIGRSKSRSIVLLLTITIRMGRTRARVSAEAENMTYVLIERLARSMIDATGLSIRGNGRPPPPPPPPPRSLARSPLSKWPNSDTGRISPSFFLRSLHALPTGLVGPCSSLSKSSFLRPPSFLLASMTHFLFLLPACPGVKMPPWARYSCQGQKSNARGRGRLVVTIEH